MFGVDLLLSCEFLLIVEVCDWVWVFIGGFFVIVVMFEKMVEGIFVEGMELLFLVVVGFFKLLVEYLLEGSVIVVIDLEWLMVCVIIFGDINWEFFDVVWSVVILGVFVLIDLGVGDFFMIVDFCEVVYDWGGVWWWFSLFGIGDVDLESIEVFVVILFF